MDSVVASEAIDPGSTPGVCTIRRAPLALAHGKRHLPRGECRKAELTVLAHFLLARNC
jgi:hypothetical protein